MGFNYGKERYRTEKEFARFARACREAGMPEDAIAEMIPTLRENKGEPFGSFKKLTMEDAAEIYRLAL